MLAKTFFLAKFFSSKCIYSCILVTDYVSPLDQFEIRDLLSLDSPVFGNVSLSLANITIYLTSAAFLTLILNLIATNYNKVVLNK